MISREIFSVANMASGVFFVVASFPDFFSQFWVSPVSPPSHPLFLCILSMLFITVCRDVLAMPTWCLIAIGDIHPVFSLTNASVGARVFSRLARSRKINLTVPSGSASWPISAIHWHDYSIWDTLFSLLACFHTSLVIRFTSGCGQLPFTLCVVAIAVYVSVYSSICGARTNVFLVLNDKKGEKTLFENRKKTKHTLKARVYNHSKLRPPSVYPPNQGKSTLLFQNSAHAHVYAQVCRKQQYMYRYWYPILTAIPIPSIQPVPK